MARSAFLPAIALLALAPGAGAQIVIGGPTEISVDLSALDALRPARPLARASLTAPAASLPALPAPLAAAAPTMRPAAVL
ncbi:MAG: hypothetical protein JWM77_567, partial [Rhodospirillales bacterium]|nr:hypothetical protein [Rhodospirillales bacterium]